MRPDAQTQRLCSVAQLRQGQCGRLVAVNGERAYRRRLMELGLTPGTEVRVLKVAPLGDPLEIEVRGSRLSLRRAEAATLSVIPLEQLAMPSLRALLNFSGQRSAA